MFIFSRLFLLCYYYYRYLSWVDVHMVLRCGGGVYITNVIVSGIFIYKINKLATRKYIFFLCSLQIGHYVKLIWVKKHFVERSEQLDEEFIWLWQCLNVIIQFGNWFCIFVFLFNFNSIKLNCEQCFIVLLQGVKNEYIYE